MSASISFHGPYAYRAHHYPPGTVEHHPAPYSSLGIEDGNGSDVTLYFGSRDALDGLLEAAAALRGEWPEPDAQAGPVLDSESWTCGGCGGVFIGHRPEGNRCGNCDGHALPALPARHAITCPAFAHEYEPRTYPCDCGAAPLPPYTEPPGVEHCAPGHCTCGTAVTP